MTPGKAESVTVRDSVDEKDSDQLSPRADKKDSSRTEENASITEDVPYMTGIKFYLLYSGMLLS